MIIFSSHFCLVLKNKNNTVSYNIKTVFYMFSKNIHKNTFSKTKSKHTINLQIRKNKILQFTHLSYTQGQKKSVFSADISPKNMFSAGTKKKKQRKNQSEEKSVKSPIFHRKNQKIPIFLPKIAIVEHVRLY